MMAIRPREEASINRTGVLLGLRPISAENAEPIRMIEDANRNTWDPQLCSGIIKDTKVAAAQTSPGLNIR
jgi:hypothetical protein